MGDWNITIRGIGAHHNKLDPSDANRMAAAFVKELIKAGHYVTDASFTYGGSDTLKDPDFYIQLRDSLEKSKGK